MNLCVSQLLRKNRFTSHNHSFINHFFTVSLGNLRMSIRNSILLLLIASFFIGCNEEEFDPLFSLLDIDQTGIDFTNTLENSDSLIALSFEYLFNGSGVGIADFNNDGRSDIFFSANMEASKIYLNQGDLKFEDITAQSGINTEEKWASGVTIVDINSDGWQDIYLSIGGLSTDKEKRSNLLYINQGVDPNQPNEVRFTEESAAFGLDDSGYSINALFFDYDNDDDLDMYLLTTELDPYNWTDFRPRRLNGEASNTDRLYRNNGNNTFTNVSLEAGITIEGYGLGVALHDINEDGFIDLYIANDFLSNDVIYINNGDGSFTDKIDDYLSHTSRNGMGIDMQDFNNDGHTDIMVLDMLPSSNARQKSMFGFFNYDKFKLGIESGYQPQYARNSLQLNNGNGKFSEVAQLAGVDKTDWSWCALFADYDNDGWQDLFITNGYRQDITNMDFATYSRQVTSSPIGTEEAKKLQMMRKLSEMPEIKMPNMMYQNLGTMPFKDKTKEWGFDLPTYSNGAAYADLDNDGDLDLVINNIDERAYVYENNLYTQSKKNENNYLRIKLNPKGGHMPIGTKVSITTSTGIQTRLMSPYRGYLSSVEDVLHFGLGADSQIELLTVEWADGSVQTESNIKSNHVYKVNYQPNKEIKSNNSKNQTSLFIPKDIGIDYMHQENDFVDFKIQPILPHKHSQSGPGISVADINGDGKEDFYVGGSYEFNGSLFTQNPKNSKFLFTETKLIEPIPFHDMGSLLFDADQDGDQDLYVVSGGSNYQDNTSMYQDRLYLNDGAGNFTKSSGLPEITASGSDVNASDFDKDGDLDLFIAGRVVPGAYPLPAQSYLLRNDTKGGEVKFSNVSNLLPNDGKLGLVSDALWTDVNNDGDIDLILAGEWMPITILLHQDDAFKSTIEIENSNGWWNSLAAGDFDKDGDIDYIAGNLGLNSRYQASVAEPVRVHAKDYDKNGRVDPVMSYYIEGKNYIAHSRDMLIKQINSMRVRFKTYAEYGTATFDKSFTKDELADALILNAKTFHTSYIENKGNGTFTLRALDMKTQTAPMFGIMVEDYNLDGNLDVMMIGNSYASEIMVGQYDASIGNILLGDGSGNFEALDYSETNFSVDKDAKALIKIQRADETALYLATRNRNSIVSYAAQQNPQSNRIVQLKNNETHAFLIPEQDEKYKVEFHYGSTYLSQSSRTFVVPIDVLKMEIYNESGISRIIESF